MKLMRLRSLSLEVATEEKPLLEPAPGRPPLVNPARLIVYANSYARYTIVRPGNPIAVTATAGESLSVPRVAPGWARTVFVAALRTSTIHLSFGTAPPPSKLSPYGLMGLWSSELGRSIVLT